MGAEPCTSAGPSGLDGRVSAALSGCLAKVPQMPRLARSLAPHVHCVVTEVRLALPCRALGKSSAVACVAPRRLQPRVRAIHRVPLGVLKRASRARAHRPSSWPVMVCVLRRAAREKRWPRPCSERSFSRPRRAPDVCCCRAPPMTLRPNERAGTARSRMIRRRFSRRCRRRPPSTRICQHLATCLSSAARRARACT